MIKKMHPTLKLTKNRIRDGIDLNGFEALELRQQSETPRYRHILDKRKLNLSAIKLEMAVKDTAFATVQKGLSYEKDRIDIGRSPDAVGLHGNRQRRYRNTGRGTFFQLRQHSHENHERPAHALRTTVTAALHTAVTSGPDSLTRGQSEPRASNFGKKLPDVALTIGQAFALLWPQVFHHLTKRPSDVQSIEIASAVLFWGATRPEHRQSKDQDDDEICNVSDRRTDTFRLRRRRQRRFSRTDGHAVIQLRQCQHGYSQRAAHALRSTNSPALHLSVKADRAARRAAKTPSLMAGRWTPSARPFARLRGAA